MSSDYPISSLSSSTRAASSVDSAEGSCGVPEMGTKSLARAWTWGAATGDAAAARGMEEVQPIFYLC